MRFLLLFLFLFSFSHAGLQDYFQKITNPDAIKEKIKDEIKKLEIKTNLKIINADILDGVGLGIQYRYELEPSYQAGFYTRADRWKFNASLTPGSLIRAIDLPISLRFDPGVELYFVRQFKSQLEAATAVPYTPARLPISAKKALQFLKPGDFVAIPTHLNIVLSAGMSGGSHGVSIGGATHFILSGKFMVHLFRVSEDRMRMKIIATRSKAVGGSVGAKFDLKVFGVSIVDKMLNRIFETDIAKFSAQMKWGDLFMLDYILDLKQEDAKKAYNHVLASTLTFKNLTMTNPFAKHKKIENQILTDMTELEKLHKADLKKKKPRVRRLFKGQNEYKQKSSNFKVGLLVAKYERRKVFTENRIVSYDINDKPDYFAFNNYSFYKGSKFFFGLFKKDRVWSTSTLMSLDKDDHIKEFSDIAVSLDLRDKWFLYQEIRDALDHAKRNLSPELYDQIDFKDFLKVKFYQRVDQARLFHQVFFHEDAVKTYLDYPYHTLNNDLKEYVQTIPLPYVPDNQDPFPMSMPLKKQASHMEALSFGSNQTPDLDKALLVAEQTRIEMMNAHRSQNWQRFLDYYRASVNSFLAGLKRAFRAEGANDTEVYSKFEKEIMSLRNNQIFQLLGTGFLIDLLPEQSKKDLVHVNLAWDAEGVQPVRFRYGNNAKSEMYKNLEYIQSVLNNRGFDLRLVENQNQKMKSLRQNENFNELYSEED